MTGMKIGAIGTNGLIGRTLRLLGTTRAVSTWTMVFSMPSVTIAKAGTIITQMIVLLWLRKIMANSTQLSHVVPAVEALTLRPTTKKRKWTMRKKNTMTGMTSEQSFIIMTDKLIDQ